MSTTARDAWASLIANKKIEFNRQGYEATRVDSERTFRTAFERLCEQQNYKYIPRLANKLVFSYRRIRTFTKAVAQSVRGLSAPFLEGLIWGASFAAIKAGCKANATLDGLVDLFVKLNISVPPIAPSLAEYATLDRVQRPLKDVFHEFIDFYKGMIESFCEQELDHKSPYDPSAETSYQKTVEQSRRRFDSYKAQYDDIIAFAEELEQWHTQKDTNEDSGISGMATVGPGAINTNPYNSGASFTPIRHLGRGAFSEVEEVKEESTGDLYARKRIRIAHLEGSARAHHDETEVLKEVAIMKKLRHHHIATVLFYIKETDGYSIMMYPVAEYDLRRFLERCIAQRWNSVLVGQIWGWFGCLLEALAYAHRHNVKHGDIKPANILIKDGQPYLSDFGLARDFSALGTSVTRGQDIQGTSIYFAPESKPDGHRGRSVDIFALGCVYTEMLTVAKGKSLQAFREWRRNPALAGRDAEYAFRENIDKVKEWVLGFESDKVGDLVVYQTMKMIDEDPENRPTAQDCRNYLKREETLFCGE